MFILELAMRINGVELSNVKRSLNFKLPVCMAEILKVSFFWSFILKVKLASYLSLATAKVSESTLIGLYQTWRESFFGNLVMILDRTSVLFFKINFGRVATELTTPSYPMNNLFPDAWLGLKALKGSDSLNNSNS